MTNTRWLELMNSLGLPACEETFNSLNSAYSENHRHYHTNAHIGAMLKHFNNTKDQAENPLDVELAIWFHDAIYNPMSSKNELNSANWAKEFLLKNGMEEKQAENVHRLIMATLHGTKVTTHDQKLIVDIDLTILGSTTEVYDEYEQNIRQEYRFVPSLLYKKKRKKVLSEFLNQISIYKLDYFSERFEQSARMNLTRAISNLS